MTTYYKDLQTSLQALKRRIEVSLETGQRIDLSLLLIDMTTSLPISRRQILTLLNDFKTQGLIEIRNNEIIPLMTKKKQDERFFKNEVKHEDKKVEEDEDIPVEDAESELFINLGRPIGADYDPDDDKKQ